MISAKRLEELRKECVPIEMDDVFDTLSAALKVVEAAKVIVRPYYRQSKENAPLEYALWEALAPFSPREGNDEGKE